MHLESAAVESRTFAFCGKNIYNQAIPQEIKNEKRVATRRYGIELLLFHFHLNEFNLVLLLLLLLLDRKNE